MDSVRSMPVNSENGPSEATRAMLMRQSKLSRVAPGGATAISVVEPPPFFHGVVRQSLARTILTES
jgi:indole-3-glycerol phosphate synthase